MSNSYNLQQTIQQVLENHQEKDFNYDKWLDDQTERNQIASLTKEYYKNKEMRANNKSSDYYEDSEMSGLLKNLGLDYKTNEKGDDKNEG